MRPVHRSILFAALGATCTLAACDDGDATREPDMGGEPGVGGEPAAPDIVGAYTDDFDGRHAIGTTWSMEAGGDTLRFAFLQVDDAGRWGVAQNDPANAFSPSLFSRFDWTTADDDALFFCQTAFDAESAAAAAAIPAADASDPAAGGCADFPWSRLRPVGPGIEGSWRDDYGTDHAVGAESWTQSGDPAASTFRFVQVDPDAGWVVARNGAANAFSPGLWSRFDWARAGDDLWFCQTRYDAPTRADAARAPPADASDPSTGGCSDFPWSHLAPAD